MNVRIIFAVDSNIAIAFESKYNQTPKSGDFGELGVIAVILLL